MVCDLCKEYYGQTARENDKPKLATEQFVTGRHMKSRITLHCKGKKHKEAVNAQSASSQEDNPAHKRQRPANIAGSEQLNIKPGTAATDDKVGAKPQTIRPARECAAETWLRAGYVITRADMTLEDVHDVKSVMIQTGTVMQDSIEIRHTNAKNAVNDEAKTINNVMNDIERQLTGKKGLLTTKGVIVPTMLGGKAGLAEKIKAIFSDAKTEISGALGRITTEVTKELSQMYNRAKSSWIAGKFLSTKNYKDRIVFPLAEEILKQTVRRVKESGGEYTVLLDESSDFSKIEQLAVKVKWWDITTRQTEERLIGLEDCTDGRTTNEITRDVITLIEDLGLELKNCRGVGTDGASVMRGIRKGVATQLREEAQRRGGGGFVPTMHCATHGVPL